MSSSVPDTTKPAPACAYCTTTEHVGKPCPYRTVSTQPGAMSMAGTPLPTPCGVKLRRELTAWEAPTCARDKGHGGKHKGVVGPACDTCGAEMRYDGWATYSCTHPGVEDRRAVRRANELLRSYRRVVAYALAGQADEGQAIPSGCYDNAVRVLAVLQQEGALS